MSSVQTMTLFSQTLRLAFTDEGTGRPFLILHGGAGPASVSTLARALSLGGRAVVPTLPGFNGEPRPEWLHSVTDLTLALLALVDRLDLSDVVILGNSFGGWLATEMALRRSPRIAAIVLMNAVGLEPGPTVAPILDPLSVPPADRAALSFHDPQKFGFSPAPDQIPGILENQKALRTYTGGGQFFDPGLGARMGSLEVPSLVVWGEGDRIARLDYGRQWARTLPGARFEPVAEAGHFPQIEKTDQVVALIRNFLGTPDSPRSATSDRTA